jgi:Domain of unknown function (DUF6484)
VRHELAMPQPAGEPGDQTPAADTSPLAELLARPTRTLAATPPASEIVIGRLWAVLDDHVPSVTWPGGPVEAQPAASLVAVTPADVGRAVALAFPAGASQPLILGLVWSAAPAAIEAEVDGQHVAIEAESSITLRCGQASITLTADGQVLLRGSYVSSHSTGTQRIKGAAVRIN